MVSGSKYQRTSNHWEIAGVFPNDFEDFGDWVLQKALFQGPNIKVGIIYHKHITDNKITLFMVGENKLCRRCNTLVPTGVLFRARTSSLDNTGSN